MTKEEAFEFLCRVAQGIALMMGNNCEALVQEVIDGQMTTVAIYNGHVSGREVMSQIGILGGIINADKIDYDVFMTDINNKLVTHPSGKRIKSSTFVMEGEGYKYALGINIDITYIEKMHNIYDSFLNCDGDLFSSLSSSDDEISVEGIVHSCIKAMNKESGKFNKEERHLLIKLLLEKNYFDLHKSVPYLADRLGVSNYTVYKDIKEIKKKQ